MRAHLYGLLTATLLLLVGSPSGARPDRPGTSIGFGVGIHAAPAAVAPSPRAVFHAVFLAAIRAPLSSPLFATVAIPAGAVAPLIKAPVRVRLLL